ncbi:MAG TPA: fibronectin type III domain-containing protein [Candidatus Dormibacteraeota bacterium]
MRNTRLVASSALIVVAAALVAIQARPAQAANVPGTSCSVFPPSNIWNTDISGLPVHPQSGAWLASTGATTGRLLHPDFGQPPYGIPFNVVNSAHATTSFTFQYASESDPGLYPYGNDLLIEQGSDAHLLSINKDTCKLYETFATNSSGPSTAGSGAIFDLGSNQLRPNTWTSADAAGLPIFPGLVRLDEVQAGLIGHAIRFTVQNSDKSYLWPARHQAGSANNPNLPPMGARFRLKASYDISAFGHEAQVVLTAFKHYGLIVADNGSDWFFTGTEDPGWNSGPYIQMISDLKQVPASQFEAVDESALMVDPNSAVAGTVPAAPVAPTATARSGGAQVTWTAPANGGQPIQSYKVTGSPSGQVIVSGSVTTAVVSGLTNGTSYTFTVTAINVIGSGAPSPPSNAVVPDSRLTAQSQPAPAPSRTAVNQSPVRPGGSRLSAVPTSDRRRYSNGTR